MYFGNVVQRLKEATARVEGEYFLLQVAGGPPQWRERVYCYELYHQLRHAWTDEFMLAAEVDKSSHPLPHFLLEALRNVKPDFIVHDPGHEHEDIAVVEVKSAQASVAAITKDYLTLLNFCQHAKYRGAIMLLFGQPKPRGQSVLAKATAAFAAARESAGFECERPVLTLHHRQVGEPAEIVIDADYQGV